MYDREISKMAGASTRDSFGRNASRNLHSYVHKTGKTLAVKVTGVKGVPIKGTSKYKKPGVCKACSMPV